MLRKVGLIFSACGPPFAVMPLSLVLPQREFAIRAVAKGQWK